MKDQLEKRLTTIDRLIVAKEALLQERKDQLSRLETKVQSLHTEKILLEKVDETLLAVSSKVLGQSITTIDKLVTAGLKAVFRDQNLEFHTKVDKSRGKTSVEFLLSDDGRIKPLMDSYGGGPLVVAGVLLRIATIMILNLRRVLVLDESLSHVSPEYVGPTSALLRRLAKELDFSILMITQQPEFAQHADRHYKAKHTAAGTEFELAK
jgi:DNA repair exonuclease SbcCD ATPase subunit